MSRQHTHNLLHSQDPTYVAAAPGHHHSNHISITTRQLHNIALPIHIHLFPPFFFPATTLKPPLVSSLATSGLATVFFATSLHPATALPFAGLATLKSTCPFSASLLRLKNSSAKWRESIVVEAPCTVSVTPSGSRATIMEKNSSTVTQRC